MDVPLSVETSITYKLDKSKFPGLEAEEKTGRGQPALMIDTAFALGTNKRAISNGKNTDIASTSDIRVKHCTCPLKIVPLLKLRIAIVN